MKSTDYIEKIEMNAKSKGIYSIDLCPISNTIRFTAKYAGCMYAYVVGDFNGWEKSDDYKLTWQIDTNDKELKMIKEVKFPNKLPPGKYRYKYILIDTDGNEIWVDSYGNEKNLNVQSCTARRLVFPSISNRRSHLYSRYNRCGSGNRETGSSR